MGLPFHGRLLYHFMIARPKVVSGRILSELHDHLQMHHLLWSVLKSLTAASYLSLLARELDSFAGGWLLLDHHCIFLWNHT